MTRTQVHDYGTAIVIDRAAGKVRWEYPESRGSAKLGKVDEYDITEEWIQKYANCRVCGKPLDDNKFAYALWRNQGDTCSIECVQKEHHKRYACCDKAVPRGCVCTASFDCPIHGRVCIGTHD